MQLIFFSETDFFIILFCKNVLRFSLSPLGSPQQQLRRIFLSFSLEISIVEFPYFCQKHADHCINYMPGFCGCRLVHHDRACFIFFSCEIISKFGRCRFVLFLRVESLHQVSVIQSMLKLQLLSLEISKRLSKFFHKLLIFVLHRFVITAPNL